MQMGATRTIAPKTRTVHHQPSIVSSRELEKLPMYVAMHTVKPQIDKNARKVRTFRFRNKINSTPE